MEETSRKTPVPPLISRRAGMTLLALLGLVLVGALVLWLALPGLRRPVDLSVRFTPKDYQSMLDKLGMRVEAAQSGQATAYGPPREVSATLNERELTAFWSINRPKDAAVRWGQVELSGDRIALSLKVATQQVLPLFEEYLAADQLPMPEEINVYAVLRLTIAEGRSALELLQLNVMGVDLPAGVREEGALIDYFQSVIDENVGALATDAPLRIDALYCSDGQIHVRGSVPEWMRIAQAGKEQI